MKKSTQIGSSRVALLATVSTMTLAISLCAAHAAGSEPPVWVDLGWHAEHVFDSKNEYQIPVPSLIPQSGLTGPLAEGLIGSHSSGSDGRISFRPEGTDWTFSATLSYGRSHGKKTDNFRQTQVLPTTSVLWFHSTIPTYPIPWHRTTRNPLNPNAIKVASSERASQVETHVILDFEAGKDVGLGLFGSGSTSTLGAGVRFANLHSTMNFAKVHGTADIHISQWHLTHPTYAFFPSSTRIVPWYFNGENVHWKTFTGTPRSSHSFIGAGPAVYWEASSPLLGNPSHGGELSLNWALNAALLFGKQKTSSETLAVVQQHCEGFHQCTEAPPLPPYGDNVHVVQSRSVTVPSLSGMFGFSYRLEDIKLNLGYRADFFFRAMDTGVPGQGSSTRGFHGPFASVSIGLGD